MISKEYVLVFLFLIMNSGIIHAQSVDINAGLSINSFYHLNNDSHLHTDHLARNGITMGMGIEEIKVDWLTMRFTLRLDTYEGKITEKYHGLASGSTIEAQFSKSVITLGMMPVNLYLLNHIDLNAGINISGLISETFSGTKSGHTIDMVEGYQFYEYNLSDQYNRFNNRWYFGLKARVAYDFYLSEKLVLSPQYSFYLGISDEFSALTSNTKLLRHCFCIGMEKRIR